MDLEHETIKRYETQDVLTCDNGNIVYKSRYWVCEDGDAQKAIFINNVPQCHENTRITESMLRGIRKRFNINAEIVYIPLAFANRKMTERITLTH